jgi:F1F0 ATPase subunit 2
MYELYLYLFNFVAGVGLGIFCFGGLWLTVRQLATTEQPLLWMGLSFLGRLGLTLFGFYLVADGHWERLLVTIAGFFLARLLLVRRLSNLKQQRI